MRLFLPMPSIALLFGMRCPSAITWFIVAIIVNPIDGISRLWERLFSHVGKKISKHIPPFAYSNTACAVKPIVRLFWLRAPLSYSSPAVVLWRRPDLWTITMNAMRGYANSRVVSANKSERLAFNPSLLGLCSWSKSSELTTAAFALLSRYGHVSILA